MSDYSVPAAPLQVEYEIKKSRFIARAALARDREQALQVLAEAKAQFPDARHHCWAYLIGNPWSPGTVAMSDDGEPTGTAGKPILNVLQHKQVGDIMLVVSRYFGGIKLGAGGLVRAYSQAAQLVMADLSLARQVSLCRREVQLDFSLEQGLRHWMDLHGGHLVEVSYTQQVNMVLDLPESALQPLQEFAAANGMVVSVVNDTGDDNPTA
ncbi:YigZ family protein [Pseudomaricurvus sp. HS19]|uniref:IMPACT family protein n=1 Tax=Pseudomaricurvus sp. HS19 TaxID=2692626 RepID=UPI00136A0029|nr:YigZ family protein [Pseudomaricurvus sp. HS19]MYM62613.1 DUF1949 domain-containing protein [Pseudomaricurvus sp. HS19]